MTEFGGRRKYEIDGHGKLRHVAMKQIDGGAALTSKS